MHLIYGIFFRKVCLGEDFFVSPGRSHTIQVRYVYSAGSLKVASSSLNLPFANGRLREDEATLSEPLPNLYEGFKTDIPDLSGFFCVTGSEELCVVAVNYIVVN